MWSCIVLYLLTLVAAPGGIRGGGMMNFLSPAVESLFVFGASGALPVFQFGRWWTVLSAGWLHGSILHIFFNMMSLRQLAPATVEFYGASRMIIIYTVASVIGFVASSLAGLVGLPMSGRGITVGASAAIFGLLGSLIYYGRRTGSSSIGDQAKGWALSIFILGFIMPAIDNWAHLGGLAGGYATSRFLDPLHPERLDHLIIALVCLGLTGIAVVFSILHGLALFR
jgi:rhomboid protease GluP